MNRLFEIYNKVNKTHVSESLQYSYDDKGNYIPKGLESKNIALRPVELPMNSNNTMVYIVKINDQGEVLDILDKKTTWDEAKKDISKYL